MDWRIFRNFENDNSAHGSSISLQLQWILLSPPLPLLISFLHTNFHKISALIFSSVMMSFTLLLVVLLVNFRRLATFPLRRFRTSSDTRLSRKIEETRLYDRILPSDFCTDSVVMFILTVIMKYFNSYIDTRDVKNLFLILIKNRFSE